MEAGDSKAKEYFENLRAAFHFDCYKENKPEGCHQYAEFLSVVEKDPVRSAEVFEKNCNAMKFGESCLALGNMYLTGKGLDKDIPKALLLYEEACKLESMGGCNNAGLITQNGHQSLKPNGDTAEKYFKQSCDGNFKNGCFNLSLLYLKGDLVNKDMPKALEYSLKSCNLGHPWGCGNASRILKTGDGVPQDKVKGEQLLKKAKEMMKP